MTDFRIVFIHGYTASHITDWYPQISEELHRLGVDYVIPDLPGGEYPHAQEWLSALHNVVTQSNKPLVFVGHSLGTRAVLLYLEKYQPYVEKVFLISAFANRVENADLHNGETYPDFFTHTINIEKIKPLAGKFVVIHSKDDTHEPPIEGIDYEQGEEIAQELGAELISVDGRGHFDHPEDAEPILNILRNELNF